MVRIHPFSASPAGWLLNQPPSLRVGTPGTKSGSFQSARFLTMRDISVVGVCAWIGIGSGRRISGRLKRRSGMIRLDITFVILWLLLRRRRVKGLGDFFLKRLPSVLIVRVLSVIWRVRRMFLMCRCMSVLGLKWVRRWSVGMETMLVW